jgi:hypothetical protein
VDIVQISEQALQLQVASSLFGTTAGSSTATGTAIDPSAQIIQALNNSLTESAAAVSGKASTASLSG